MKSTKGTGRQTDRPGVGGQTFQKPRKHGEPDKVANL